MFRGRLDNDNTQKLMVEMSPDELKTFPVDLRIINWRNYFVNVHIPGLKRHVLMKGGRSALD